MKRDQFPFVTQIVESGADDRVFDALLLSGPVLIGLIAVLGRSIPSVVLALGYLLLFVGEIVHNRHW